MPGVFQFDRAIISSLNPRPLRAIGALTQASYPKLGVAIESLHCAKTGVTEQELDGWSTTQMIE